MVDAGHPVEKSRLSADFLLVTAPTSNNAGLYSFFKSLILKKIYLYMAK